MAASSLLTNLAAYYKLEAASGSRVDELGGASLSPMNAPGNTAGIQGNALSLSEASTQFLSCADDAAHSMSDIDMSISVWVFLTGTPSGNNGIVCKRDDGTHAEYVLYMSGTTLFWQVSNDGTAFTQTPGVTLTTGVWHHIHAYHNAGTNTIGVRVDDTTDDTASHSTGIVNSTSAFEVGRLNGFNTLNGKVDELGLWKGSVLTGTQVTNLYNGGSGVTYPFVGVP